MDNQFSFEGSPMPPDPGKPQKKKDGYATASLVLGIVALVLSCPCCCCLYPIAGVCAILAIVFASISLKRNGKNGKAVAGLILGILALIILIVVIIAIVASPSDATDSELSTDQALIDRMYRLLEKYAGKEFADEWYDEMMKALQQQDALQPQGTEEFLYD